MKTNRTKYIIAAVSLFLLSAIQAIETEAQLYATQNATSNGVFASKATSKEVVTSESTSSGIFDESTNSNNGESTLFKAGPPGGGDAQREAPILEGLWTLTGLAVVYGIFIFCRKHKK